MLPRRRFPTVATPMMPKPDADLQAVEKVKSTNALMCPRWSTEEAVCSDLTYAPTRRVALHAEKLAPDSDPPPYP